MWLEARNRRPFSVLDPAAVRIYHAAPGIQLRGKRSAQNVVFATYHKSASQCTGLIKPPSKRTPPKLIITKAVSFWRKCTRVSSTDSHVQQGVWDVWNCAWGHLRFWEESGNGVEQPQCIFHGFGEEKGRRWAAANGCRNYLEQAFGRVVRILKQK